jgi:hypothetical protein
MKKRDRVCRFVVRHSFAGRPWAATRIDAATEIPIDSISLHFYYLFGCDGSSIFGLLREHVNPRALLYRQEEDDLPPAWRLRKSQILRNGDLSVAVLLVIFTSMKQLVAKMTCRKRWRVHASASGLFRLQVEGPI